MNGEPANQYRLLVKREPDGTEKQAVEVRLEVPEGFCWQDLGHQMLSFGMRYISAHTAGEKPHETSPDDLEPEPSCPPHDWVVSYRGTTRSCSRCRAFEKSMNTELTEEDEGFDGVCKLCGTDCGEVNRVFERNAKLATALREIELLSALDSKIYQIATEALKF